MRRGEDPTAGSSFSVYEKATPKDGLFAKKNNIKVDSRQGNECRPLTGIILSDLEFS